MVSNQVLIIGFVIFWTIVTLVGRTNKAKKAGFETKPLYIIWKYHKIEQYLVKLSSRKKFWNIYADLSVILGIILLIGSVAFLTNNIINLFNSQDDFLGVTILIPFVTLKSPDILLYFFLAVPLILILHEGAHGVISVLEKIKVESGGFAILGVLIAGFVEPNEDEFKKAKSVSKLRLIGAGSSANLVSSIFVAALLITTPFFGAFLPLPVRDVFYKPSIGLPIFDVDQDLEEGNLGLLEDDIITEINGKRIRSPQDLQEIEFGVGESVEIGIIRNGEQRNINIITSPSEDDPSKGMIGIKHLGTSQYPSKFPISLEFSRSVTLFLFWFWFLSWHISIFNMLPLYPLDGDQFFAALLEKISDPKKRKIIRYLVNVLIGLLLIGNLVGTFLISGLLTL